PEGEKTPDLPEKTRIMLLLRARKFDEFVRKYLLEYPYKTTCIQLGCGLDSRHQRVGTLCRHWYDIDLPEMIRLRKNYYQDSTTYTMIGCTAADHSSWLESIELDEKPVLLLAEGLMMYLSRDEVRELLNAVCDKTVGSVQCMFDVFSKLAAKKIPRHPSLKAAGTTVQWGCNDPREIETWVPGLRLKEQWLFTDSLALAHLGLGYKALFSLASMFKTARTAHSVVRFEKTV
ncbi:MAG: class I SAM-dependent methyltransferase, partial [Spirochaetota bacterium]